MRFRHPDGSTVHLAYCSNVHPAEDLDGVIAQLITYAAPVRRHLDRSRLGVGLWIGEALARHLDADADALRRLRAALVRVGCEVVTLNGFPYTGFHDTVVKHRVYRPDWLEAERTDHTLRLARILTRLLPDDVEDGTISTLPLGWPDRIDGVGTDTALDALDRVADELAGLVDRTGRHITLAVEPEPGCRIETTTDAGVLLAASAGPHLGACADLCHMAVQFEDPAEALPRLVEAGVGVAKAQVSSGLRIPDASDPAAQRQAQTFTASPFLHQTRTRDPGGSGAVVGVDDLPQALDGGLPSGGEWRVHVHLPIHLDGPGTTRDVLDAGLTALVGGVAPLTRHLEVETYTWSTLPAESRPTSATDPVAALVEGIAAEVGWTADRLTQLGLTELT